MSQSERTKSEDTDPLIVSIFMVLISLTIVLIFVYMYLGILINNDSTCGVTNYNDLQSNTRLPSNYAVTNDGHGILQGFYVTDSDNIYYEFCFYGNLTGTDAAELSIIGQQEDKELGNVLVSNTENYYCVPISNILINHNNLIGLSCVSCGVGEEFVIFEDPFSTIVPILEIDAIPPTTYEVNLSESLAFSLRGYRSCNYLVTFYSRLYIYAIIIIGIMLLAIVGWKKLRDKLMEAGGFA